MNILEFVQYPSTQVRTSAGQVVTIDKIVRKDQFPIVQYITILQVSSLNASGMLKDNHISYL